MSMVSQGQSLAQMVHPVHRSQSTRQMGFSSGRDGLGILTIQSTGQTVMHASHPVQPFSLIRALGRGLRGFRAPAGLAVGAAVATGAGVVETPSAGAAGDGEATGSAVPGPGARGARGVELPSRSPIASPDADGSGRAPARATPSA